MGTDERPKRAALLESRESETCCEALGRVSAAAVESRVRRNQRTILRDRILAIGLDAPAASQRAFLLKLVKDRKLPAETRMAVAPQCFPPKLVSDQGVFLSLHFLFKDLTQYQQ
jgi:hypothetical protein